MQEMMYGYIRVSTKDQHEDRQIFAMIELGIPKENIYVDKQSGNDFNRPQYKKLLRKIGEGSVIYIKSIDKITKMY